jgi:hypothetical protein
MIMFFSYKLNEQPPSTAPKSKINDVEVSYDTYLKFDDGRIFSKIIDSARSKSDTSSIKKQLDQYSKWPNSINLNDSVEIKKLETDKNLFLNCFITLLNENDKKDLSIENFEAVVISWTKSKNQKCSYYYQIFDLIYDVKFKHNHLNLESDFANKVKQWLNNDEKLMKSIYSQVRKT